MSFDVALWHEDHPITTDEAAEFYQRVSEDQSITVPPYAGLQSFLKDLTAQFPALEDVPDEALETCPWSSTFGQPEGFLEINMAFSRVDEVLPVIHELAATHDLVCYDPQWPAVIYPPRLAALPHLRLTTEDWTLIDNPSKREITATLKKLNNDGNSFAILEKTDDTYLQTAVQGDGQYVVEHRAGSAADHFRTYIADFDVLKAMFHDYSVDKVGWDTKQEWEGVTF